MSNKTDKIHTNKLTVDKQACFNGDVTFHRDIKVKGDVSGDLTVTGTLEATQIINGTEALTLVLQVPSKYPTLADALAVAFSPTLEYTRFRIILETQGPHTLPPAHWSSNKLEYLSIEASRITDHFGMYYGHNVGAYSRLGVKQLSDESLSGVGPFSVVLSGGNTIITVTGNEVDYPLGFGSGIVKAPGWVFGAPPGAILGISPNFGPVTNGIQTGDTIRWYDEPTATTTSHTVTVVSGNSLTVTPAISTPVVKGCGFSIVPKSTILLGVAPLLPEFAFPGSLLLNGLHFESLAPTPFIPTLTVSQATTITQRCLFHTQLIFAAGSNNTSLVPNTFMDTSGGPNSAKLWVNSAASVYCFRQHFIGPSAGFYGRGGGTCTMCFSLWVGNNIGVSFSDNTSCKTDGAELYKCTTGVSLDGACRIVQMIWTEGCSTGIRCRNNSNVGNSNIIDYGPLPVFPLLMDGQGSGVGLDFDYNSHLSTSRLRLRSLTTHANIDGNPVVIPVVAATSTLYSDNGSGSYGTHLSGLVFTDSDVSV